MAQRQRSIRCRTLVGPREVERSAGAFLKARRRLLVLVRRPITLGPSTGNRLALKHMQKVQAAPVASRLIEGLRDLGYDFETAIADLVDNSLEADATEIDVDVIPANGRIPAHVIIADNGTGIARGKLTDVMRLGVQEEHSPDDLGKYGLGLKTASLSQASVLTVSSRAESSRQNHVARWDLKELDVKWDLQLLDDEDLRDWEKKALGAKVARTQGTVVLWSELNASLLLDSSSERRREDALADILLNVERHLREVFHRFLEHAIPRRRKVEIRVGGTAVLPADPFCRSESTKELKVEEFAVQVNETKTAPLTLSPYILPHEKEFSSKKAHDDAGWGNWNQRQGLYFYRNNRLIQAGGWSWLRTHDEHIKLLRIAVDFTGELDKSLNVNVSKMRARIPAEVRVAVRNAVSAWAKLARQRYDKHRKADKGSQQTAASKPSQKKEQSIARFGSLIVTKALSSGEAPSAEARGGRINMVVPPDHPTFERDAGELESFTAAVVELVACVADRQISPKDLPVKSLRKKLKELL